MPVEIITGTTDSEIGEIDQADLFEMKDDFINEVDVKPYNGRTRIVKKFSVSVMVSELKNLIRFYETQSSKGIQIIKLNCAVHLENISACDETDYADSLTIVVEAANFINPAKKELGHISHNEIGDFVVIPGYNSSIKNQWTVDDPCCPSTNP